MDVTLSQVGSEAGGDGSILGIKVNCVQSFRV